MKKILFLALALLCLVSNYTFASASKYKLNLEAVNQVFEKSQEVSTVAILSVDEMTETKANADASLDLPQANLAFRAGDKDPLIAFLLSWFIGGLGIHRFYMGTKPLTGVAYILTGGGCGIVWLVDTIMLLLGVLDDDISRYIDNPKFFMWMGENGGIER